uniref:Radial spokehead-like protein n=1 Tax=Emiliania huxleyi TaxID=2903 RepID=A0A7S3RRD2_EMIHU|mmetsp:Transcript_23238/g.68341  ORF Transcript_23238/g.68341 Transcript_23238/m.68341 type:complete len:440 (-) Transcript_23238:238-1557(-)
MSDKAEAVSFLQRPNEKGVSVYSHLTDVLATILASNPADALGAFEALSAKVKSSSFDPAAVTVPPPPPTTAPEVPDSGWLERDAALLKSGSEDEADGQIPPSLLDDARLLDAAGASLSPEETYRAHLSLCALQRTAKLQSVRFFGKILGTAADYYVAEARRAEPPEPPEASEPSATPAEEYGSGCNALSYFVTPELGGTWEELPSVTPEAIVAASRTRKFFTGSLDADVCCFPPFPGTERHYLRAQLARIAHGTTLCPSHKYALSPEGAVEPADPEAEGALPPPTSSQLCEPASWRHKNMGILAIGRCTNLPSPEEAEADAPPPQLEPEKPALLPIEASDWALVGPAALGGGAAVVWSRSLRWPGAIAVSEAKEGRYANLYLGYGHPVAAGPMSPSPPPPIEGDDPTAEPVEAEDMPLDDENAAVREAAEAALRAGAEE